MRINTVPHQNSVLHDVLKLVPWGIFEGLVEDHGADHRVRTLSTKSQLIALLYGQLSGISGLRELVAAMKSHEARLYHLGCDPVQRSTLSDANSLRPSEVFSGLFGAMVAQVHRGLRKTIKEATYLIDSTSVPLNGLSEWAQFSAGVCNAKVHVIYDPDADCPIYAAVSAGKVNDITPAKAMPIEPGATYVFDLGYYDYGWWAKLDAAQCRIVTRFKASTPLKVIEKLAVKGEILSDRIGFLPERQSHTRKNPMQDAVREVRVKTESGKILRLLSNDLDAPAQEIADLYKRRWAIELFFRWVKQTLKITRFMGTSENAIRIQIAVALIAFLLLRLAQAAQSAIESPLVFARLIRANLMHKKRIDRLLEPEQPANLNPNQMALLWR